MAAHRRISQHGPDFVLLIDLLRPEAIPVAVSLLFAMLGAVVWVISSGKSS